MNTAKKIPVVTEILGKESAVMPVGMFVTNAAEAREFIRVVRESIAAVNLEVPETAVLLEGEVFYEEDRIREVRLLGYDANLLNAEQNNFEEAIFHSKKKPSYKFLDTSDGKKVIMPAEPDQRHIAFYLVPVEIENHSELSFLLSWNLPPTIERFDPEIYESCRLWLFFQNSCSLLATAGFLLENEEGLQFLEKSLGGLKESQLLDLLRPHKPAVNSPDSKITIQGDFEDLCYTFKPEILAYDIAQSYYKTIRFNKDVIQDLAKKRAWTEQRAKAVACVQYAAAMNECVNLALERHPDFAKKALQIFVKHLIGQDFWNYVLYNFEPAHLDYTGKKSDLRDRHLDRLFDALRGLLEAPKGRPKGSKPTAPKKDYVRSIMNAIMDLCEEKSRNSSTVKITQKEIGEKLGMTDRSVRNHLERKGENFSVLRDSTIREYAKNLEDPESM